MQLVCLVISRLAVKSHALILSSTVAVCARAADQRVCGKPAMIMVSISRQTNVCIKDSQTILYKLLIQGSENRDTRYGIGYDSRRLRSRPQHDSQPSTHLPPYPGINHCFLTPMGSTSSLLWSNPPTAGPITTTRGFGVSSPAPPKLHPAIPSSPFSRSS